MSLFYILSANQTHARLFLKQHSQLKVIKGWTHIRGKVHNRYLTSAPAKPTPDRGNRIQSEGQTPAPAETAHHGTHERLAANFARHIAVELERFRRQNPLGSLVIVATPKFMALLSQYLNPTTRSQITCTIAKDKNLYDIEDINERAELLWESLVYNFMQRHQR